jgi:hypothetical protein
MNDDPSILRHALKHSPWHYFFVPGIWQELSPSNFTPLVTLSYDIDLAFFGLNPRMFYLHHLLSIWMCSGMLYVILRGRCSRPVSLFGAFLFLLGLPLATISQELMTKHYVEGLFFSLLSVYAFQRALSRGRSGWVIISAIFYLGAMSAKEVYVPLVFLFPLLPEGQWRRRLVYSLPLFTVFFAFVFWRAWMLGASIGGYGGVLQFRELSSVLPEFFGRVEGLIFASASLADQVIVMSILAVASGIVLRSQKTALFVLWAGLLVFLPVFFVYVSLITVMPSIAVVPRYVLAIWGVCILALTTAFERLLRGGPPMRILGMVVMAVTIFYFFSHNRTSWSHTLTLSRQKSVEGQFFAVNLRDGDVVRNPVTDFAAIFLLKDYYHLAAKEKAWFLDDVFLCENPIEGKRIWSYSQRDKAMVDITASMPSIRERYCSTVRKDAPLRVNIEYSRPFVTWDMRPYWSGQYSLIFRDASDSVNVLPSGRYRVLLSEDALFRIRYESTEGWITYSPYFTISLSAPAVTWERSHK